MNVKAGIVLIAQALGIFGVLLVLGGMLLNVFQPTAAQMASKQQAALLTSTTTAPQQGNATLASTTPTTAATISVEEAIAVATAYAGGGTVQEAYLDQKNGKSVYDVEFTDGGEVYVDAVTAQVVYARLRGRTSQHSRSDDDRADDRADDRDDDRDDDRNDDRNDDRDDDD